MRTLTVACALIALFGACASGTWAHQDAESGALPPATNTPYSYAPGTPEQLQRLVAPIALYPDSLVAQILSAATFPDQVVLADRWVQAHPELRGSELAQAVDQQPWDPSIKALTAFPSVLGNMDRNLSWTSALGDAYYNQQQDIAQAIQVMRQRAQAAGNLQSNSQQAVETDDSGIVIQPATADLVYVPAYNPWLIYGDPIFAWPGWYPYPGIWYAGPYVSFGVGFGIGFFGGYGWGWPTWGFDWRHYRPIHNHAPYYSRSPTFYNRSNYYRNSGERNMTGSFAPNAPRTEPMSPTPHPAADPFGGHSQGARGYAQPPRDTGTRSGAFSGYDHGGQTRSFSSRGSNSIGGGGGGGHSGGGSHR